MSATFEKRRVSEKRIRRTEFAREEVRTVAQDVERMMEVLLLTNATGSIEIHINRGGICEIAFTEKQ